MPGKHLSPKQIAEATVLREAGYTLAAIAERLRVSVSSLQRHFKTGRVRRASAKAEAIENARQGMIEAVMSSESIKNELARLVTDDLAMSRLLRSRMAEAAEHLSASDVESAALVMRASAAFSTALKNTSEIARKGLGADKEDTLSEEHELPQLCVSELTRDEIEAMREVQDASEVA